MLRRARGHTYLQAIFFSYSNQIQQLSISGFKLSVVLVFFMKAVLLIFFVQILLSDFCCQDFILI